jgi:hypothetical protein
LKWQVRGGEPGDAGEQVHDQGEELRRQDAERRVQVEKVRAEVHQEQSPSQVQYGSTSRTSFLGKFGQFTTLVSPLYYNQKSYKFGRVVL